jgi:hypothetical protein
VRRPCRICHAELPISQVCRCCCCCCCCCSALFFSLTLEWCRHHYIDLQGIAAHSQVFRSVSHLDYWPSLYDALGLRLLSLILYLLLGHMACKELPMCLHTMEDIGDASATAGSNLGFIWRWVASAWYSGDHLAMPSLLRLHGVDDR